MSWMARLYETYESGMRLDLPDGHKLMPIGHTNQNAHIRVVLDEHGNFVRAEVLEKTQIILPATEKSANARSGKNPPPHPLADKIQYVASDYKTYGGKKSAFFKEYFRLLDGWAKSEYSHPKIVIIKNYVAKGHLVRDLVEHNILHTNGSKQLMTFWPEDAGEPPALFKSLPKEKGSLDQGNALVCWSVEIPGDPQSDTWKDLDLQSAWIKYQQFSNTNKSALCTVTGEVVPVAENHPAKLRHSGDKAKLISSNDKNGFTYRGRFLEADQPAVIGSLMTQKAHSALGWLIGRQGFRSGDQVIVSWAVSGNDIPDPMQDSFSFLGDKIEVTEIPKEIPESEYNMDVGQYFANTLKRRLAGYQAKLPPSDNIIVLGLESATPGRMAITYYQELAPQEFLYRLAKWYQDTAWFQRRTIKYSDSKGKEKTRLEWQPGTPAPKDIAEAVYGDTIGDSLKKSTVERLLPCIIEGRPLPKDFSEKAYHRAVNRQSYKSDQQWLWEKNLGIACSLFKGFHKRNTNQMRDYSMSLEEDNYSRDYLFGRLLAIAERIEEVALSVADENRSTTAARLMQRFADRPASTWRNIELALQPYIQRLKSNRAGFLYNQQQLLDDVMEKFQSGDFTNDKPLSGEFLLAFHTQRLDMKKKHDLDTETTVAE